MMKNVDRILEAYKTLHVPRLVSCAPNYSLRADETKLWLTPEFSFVSALANPIRIKHQVLQKSANIPVLF